MEESHEWGNWSHQEAWKLATLPHGQKPIGVKWIYKEKGNASGEIEHYKVRLVAKGYS